MLTMRFLRRFSDRRPVLFAIAVTVAHLVATTVAVRVLHGAGLRGYALALGVNAALAVAWTALAAGMGWWRRTGMASWPARPWTLLPLLAVALSWLVAGISVPAREVVGWALLYLVLAVHEEVASRGLVQGATERLGAWRCAAWTAGLFGLGHVTRLVVTDDPLAEVVLVVISAVLWGLGAVGLRWATGSLWPVVAFHAVWDWAREVSPGDGRAPHRLVAFLFVAAYGVTLLRRFTSPRDQRAE